MRVGDRAKFDPSIEVDGVGTVYVSGVRGLAFPSGFYRSVDGGATWIALPRPLTSALEGGAADLALDGEDGLFTTDMLGTTISIERYFPRTGELEYEKSLALAGAASVSDRTWLAAGRGPELFVNVHELPANRVVQHYTPDLRLVPAVPLSVLGPPPALQPVFDPRAAFAYTPVLEGDALAVVRTRAAFPFGTKFPVTSGLGEIGGVFAIAPVVDPDGAVYVAWSEEAPGGGFAVRLTASTDTGFHWTPPATISAGGTNVLPWIAPAGPGRLVAAWYHADGTESPAENEGPWRIEYAEIANASTPAPRSTSVILPAVVLSGRGLCLDTLACDFDTGEFLSHAFQVAAGPGGRGHVAYAAHDPASDDVNTWFVRNLAGPICRHSCRSND